VGWTDRFQELPRDLKLIIEVCSEGLARVLEWLLKDNILFALLKPAAELVQGGLIRRYLLFKAGGSTKRSFEINEKSTVIAA